MFWLTFFWGIIDRKIHHGYICAVHEDEWVNNVNGLTHVNRHLPTIELPDTREGMVSFEPACQPMAIARFVFSSLMNPLAVLTADNDLYWLA